MLRCPTCFSLLFDNNAKRCPSCRAKIRNRARPAVMVASGLQDRPLPLVEQELQARIEAETAARFMQRRRAAKAARRIAKLPPSVLASDIDLIPEKGDAPVVEASDPGLTIDLPAESVHDAKSRAEWAYVAPEPIVDTAPGTDPVIDVVVVAEPLVDLRLDAPEPVQAPEPITQSRKARRRKKPARIQGVLADYSRRAKLPVADTPVVAEPAVAEPVVETLVVEHVEVVLEPAVAVIPEPEVVLEPEVAVAEIVLEPVVVAEPEVVVVEPEVIEPEVVVPEVVEAAVVEPEVREPEVIEPEMMPAANWSKSSSVWTNRVFNTESRFGPSETVAWPPQWKPPNEFIDITDDSEQVDASRS